MLWTAVFEHKIRQSCNLGWIHYTNANENAQRIVRVRVEILWKYKLRMFVNY